MSKPQDSLATPKPLRILMIEDVEDDTLLLVDYLQSGGLVFDWERIDTERDMIVKLKESWDIIFSDFSMPSFSGMRALEITRQHDPDVPFIFISGTIGEEMAVEAMKRGAQDYVMKENLVRLLPAVDRELSDAQQRRRHRDAEKGRTQLAVILEATPDLVAILEPSGQLRYLNGAGRRLIGLNPVEDASHYFLRDLFPENIAERLLGEAFTMACEQGVWHGETALRLVDGGELPVSQVVLAHRDAAGDTEYLSTIARDISERKRFEAKLQYEATHDRLTGLPNRFFLVDRFKSALEYARRNQSHIAVLFLDIDNFKRVNDNLGHAAGDILLGQVAHRLQGCLRSNDTVARHGGDEFTIVAGDLSDPEKVLIVLHKLNEAFERPVIVHSQEIYVTFSVGIALYPHDGDGIETLLRHSDIAMYRAKSAGSNQYRFYASDMNIRGHELLKMEADLRYALEHEQFILHYQPQVDLSNGRIVGVEGLIRWQHPVRGLVSPADFIPLLENSSLIIPVGEWVLREACRLHRTWRESGFDGVRLSVNVSAVQFNDGELLDKVRRALQEEEMPQQALELEITENILMQDPVKATEILQSIHALGVRVAIDDFGTGYSSLAYLKRFPLDALKIDQAFVRDIINSASDAVIVEASISLAHKLGLEVVGEGVETVEQFEFLRLQKCNLAQGYHLGRPIPELQLSQWLAKKRQQHRTSS
ncbi:PAS domain S-box-containing protein/diguanylate cyclase (GGDEF) domain-containing protein [Nitrosomonas cryotolerans]|uniref:PAS domain S-box-containing protein/diguanylate cyclase (GGDEF) domain-containing protein n=1 Tax=Nitrosomonas cryotolerans ATCC 49181 TaxID=1131553 RepID=A0A1N6F345_9PROT|nr:EAL domain-containing protein [Nitrosomonas cryotolerans]SFP70215.1 PAS domain S-box-containing protein/diguanylate cyclase (GGDEF) domain-containing protein [Nitrosomonas cryotolerans]SIN89634.1 PAS domain S-box-containing protein/diguanylate cyclase (GGDEF) domain-containing protein [Nitrosomonas cryotolerans ATCC 49181]